MKLICEECGWRGLSSEKLSATNPFSADDIIHGCPECKSIDSFTVACDEPDCWFEVSCGTPTGTGYRQTCHKHIPK